MRKILGALAACALGATAALGGECAEGPDVLGTARTIAIAPAEYDRIGTMQYRKTLPLAEKEVVLTFDDGPVPPYTGQILRVLASQCVKATFFVVGRQARAYPDTVRRLRQQGHTIATHSHQHPFGFAQLGDDQVSREVNQGIAATAAALGNRGAVAPFFRIPGLSRSQTAERYLSAQGLSVWSADVVADDWRHISAREIVQRALTRLERKGKGVLLLHDIKATTAHALPDLLQELKTRGYRIVHVVPAGHMPAPPVLSAQSGAGKPVVHPPRVLDGSAHAMAGASPQALNSAEQPAGDAAAAPGIAVPEADSTPPNLEAKATAQPPADQSEEGLVPQDRGKALAVLRPRPKPDGLLPSFDLSDGKDRPSFPARPVRDGPVLTY